MGRLNLGVVCGMIPLFVFRLLGRLSIIYAYDCMLRYET